MDYLTVPLVSGLQGELQVPGDKSISHRALMLSAISRSSVEIKGLLWGKDVCATVQALRQMSVVIEEFNGHCLVMGRGIRGLSAPPPLYLGNAGTAMRLFCGLLSAQRFGTVLTGDTSLSSRPMTRVCVPLREMGADIEASNNGCAPITIKPVAHLLPLVYDMPVASAQLKSALLLAGIYSKGVTTIRQPSLTRDHTERMLQSFNYPTTTEALSISVEGGGVLNASSIKIPGDFSSAAFFIVAACVVAHSDLLLTSVGINSTRIGMIEILKLMGADILLSNYRCYGEEPVADIRVRASQLFGINIPNHLVSLAIDEFPVLFIAAACAKGETVLQGASELRFKESDRIAVMATGLRTLSVKVTDLEDGIKIQGGPLLSGKVDSMGDHRVAMAFAVAGQVASGCVVVKNCHNVGTSFPNFIDQAKAVGFRVNVLASH